MSGGIFTISLDFELFWGVRDHRTLKTYGNNIRNVHTVVPELLRLFRKYEIHCTWATVGMLFHRDKSSLLSKLPAHLPTYIKDAYDPYPYIHNNELEAVYHFAPDLIKQIRTTPGQELGTHTYSHFYTLEANTTLAQFADDIRMAIEVARENGITINSIVFPRNQYSEEHIAVCRQMGIKTYRGNEFSRVYKPASRSEENLFRRGIRLVDSFINLTGHHCHAVPDRNAGIVNIPASRFLRPYHPRLAAAEGLKFRRIKKSLKYAADHGLLFHLWWHPHNFGSYTEKNFSFLEKVLEEYRRLNEAGKMQSLNMNELYQRLVNGAI